MATILRYLRSGRGAAGARPIQPYLNTRSQQARGLVAWWPVTPFTGVASSTNLRIEDRGPSGGRYPATLPSMASGFITGLAHPTHGFVAQGNDFNHAGAPVTNGADFVNIPGTYNFAVFCRCSHTFFEAAALDAWAFNGTDDLILVPQSTTANGPRVFWRDLGSNIINIAHAPAADGHMHDYCFVSYAANDHRLYFDGTLLASSTATGSAGPFSGFSLMGFSENATQGYIGRICDWRLYDQAPSPALIRAMTQERWDLYWQPSTRASTFVQTASAPSGVDDKRPMSRGFRRGFNRGMSA
jgi:hypothetical protein